jgi:putative transposase
MRRAFKYRLFPNANQQRNLNAICETHRRLYNTCLEQRKTAYETEKTSVKYAEQSAWFKAERATNAYYAQLNFSSAQATMRRLDKAFQAFFRRVKAKQNPGYPRFKSRDRFRTVEFPSHGDGIRLNGNRLRVQHIGTLRVKVHRPHQGIIKTLSLTREADKWYVVLSCDLGEVQVPPNGLPAVGVDVGLEHFLSTSNGEHVANPRLLKAELPELRRRQRSLNRKKKGGSNRRKERRRVARLHARVANLRREFRHQTALSLVRRYGFVAVESLNVSGMIRNHRLSRAISDAGWYGFLNTLRTKAESAGCVVVEVDCRGTSQVCSGCGATVRKDLSVRVHACPSCSLVLQRDINAAKNILARARQARMEPVGLKLNGELSQEAARHQAAESSLCGIPRPPSGIVNED